MKYLAVGGLLAVGIVVVVSLTIGLMQEDITEQTRVAESTSEVVALSDSQNQPRTNTQSTINDLVLGDKPANTSILNITDDKILTVSLYGNKNQSGTRVHKATNDLILKNNPVKASLLKVIDGAIANETSNLLSLAALKFTRNNKQTVLAFMANMLAANDLFPTTKTSIEQKPEDIINIINAGVVLYPDFAQEVINAAVMSGEIDANEALLAAIAAGADPTTVSEATAAGGNVGGVGQPFSGLGGGGAGNETFSASNN